MLPEGWTFNGIRTFYRSDNLVPRQGHFDPKGAEITISPQGIDSVLGNVANLAKGGKAEIQVKDFSRQFRRRNRIEVEFDEAEPYAGVRDKHLIGFACGEPVAVQLRYYPASGLTRKWNQLLEEVFGGIREVPSK